MKESPILFSAPMVRALLGGRKTQTRRMLDGWTDAPPAYVEGGVITALDEADRPYRCPHTHAVGDLLWVREPWWTDQDADWISPSDLATHAPIYRQTDPKPADAGRYRQARFMCRWMSRLTLVVTDVRVQRLQEISETDAVAEGIYRVDPTPADIADGCTEQDFVFCTPGVPNGIGMTKEERSRDNWWPNARGAFRLLWDHIHGPDAWDANPWVSAYTFRLIRANIDAALADPAAHGLPPETTP